MFTALHSWSRWFYHSSWLISCPWFQDVNPWPHHTPQVWWVSDFYNGRWLLLETHCVKQPFANGMQGLLKEPSWFFVIGLGFLPLLSILTVEQTNWSCRYHGPGVQPWLIVILWPFLDFPAKVFPIFSVISAETCLMSDHPNLSDHPNRGIWGPLYCPPTPPPPLSNLPSLTSRNNVTRLYTHRSKERAFLGHS